MPDAGSRSLNNPAPKSAKKGFPKSHKLLRHVDFERVYKQGRRHFAANMTVFYLRREDEPGAGHLRIGFTVSKALAGAVQRNRMKRRLREAVRLTGLNAALGTDIVINPKRSLLTADFSALQAEVAAAFQAIEKSLGRGRRS